MNQPARFRCTGNRVSPNPHHKDRHSGSLRRQRKPAACGQVIGFRLAPQRNDHRSQRGTARALKPRLQRGLRILRLNQQHPRGIETEFRKARRIGLACLAGHHGVANPENGPHWRGPASKAQDQTQAQSAQPPSITFLGGVKLMQRRGEEMKEHALCSYFVPVKTGTITGSQGQELGNMAPAI